jgi:hypothetical protein
MWECPGGALYTREDHRRILEARDFSALAGLCIARRIAGGYRWPVRLEYPGGAVYSWEDGQWI